jgi:transcriptional regulator with GAF, ATPase, and Fis domain
MIGSTFEHAQIVNLVIDALDEILKFNVALQLIEEEDGPRLTVVSKGSIGVAMVETLKTTAAAAMERHAGRPVRVEDLEVTFKRTRAGVNEPIGSVFGSVLSSPLSIKGDPRGVLLLLAHEEEFFDGDAERTLATFAQTVAVALDSPPPTKMSRTVKELSMLFEVSKTVTSTLNLDEALQMIVSISAELMDARVAFLSPAGRNPSPRRAAATSTRSCRGRRCRAPHHQAGLPTASRSR